MFLEKWYGDIIENEQVQVHYLANFDLGPLVMGCRGMLMQGEKKKHCVAPHRLPMPALLGGSLHWPAGNDVPGMVWNCALRRQNIIWEDHSRAVSWEPVVLNGVVETAGGLSNGCGYAERLTVNFAPWELGMLIVKRGRFCGMKHNLAWMGWSGKTSAKLAILDGKADELISARRREILTTHANLAIGMPIEIAKEPLGSAPLKEFDEPQMLAARHFLSGIETKWLAEASIKLPGGEKDHGYAIYEEIRW